MDKAAAQKPTKTRSGELCDNYESADSRNEFTLVLSHKPKPFLPSVGSAPDTELVSEGLSRAAQTLNLQHEDMADLIGVDPEKVRQWLQGAPLPTKWVPKIGSIVAISDMLLHNLKEGHAPIVARRRAERYGNRSMLDMITLNRHTWLEQATREMFDYSALR